MMIRNCIVVSRYGDDDFSVWFVDITEDEYTKLTENAEVVSGEKESILLSLPVDGKLYFFNMENDHAEILSCKAEENFIDEYNASGVSYRGPMKGVLYEIMTSDQYEVTVTMTMEESDTVRNLIELELCNCDNKAQERILDAALAKLEKAMSQCVIPDYEAEQDDELEP